ncbi:MAG: peptidoglycan-binding protein LysM [Thermoanaerobaculia bacterium]|nr:peptidoglycan-binding protein LysM [Thermoanaerobaculia bacterium]
MGIFDFVKNAGETVFGKDEPKVAPQVREFDPAKLAQLKRTKALQNLVAKLGLEVEGLRVELSGDTAVVHGKVDDQAEREKVVLALGNVIGIAHVDDRMETVAKQPEAVFYTVKSGDSLSKIAKVHYGDAGKYTAIFEANRPMLKHVDKIYPGQVLRLPPVAD